MVLLGIAKLGTLNDYARVTLQSLIAYFGAYVFAFSITVCPNEQDFRVPCLLSDIVCNCLLVLRQ